MAEHGMKRHSAPRATDSASDVHTEGPRQNSLTSLAASLNGPAPVQRAADKTGLPPKLKAGVEALSGMAMDHVRVHYNSSKPAQMQAHAYAQGSDIHVGPGQEKHLPHEAWHVVQQAQGRVRPTAQLKPKVPINDDKTLELEADRMGARALATPGGPNPLPAAKPSSADRTLQPKWILRNGEWKWVADDYKLQNGEREPFSSSPSVTFDKGKHRVVFDSAGGHSVEKRGSEEPTHEELQKTRKAQGQEFRKRLKLDPDILSGQTREFDALTDNLEVTANKALPSNHREKAKKLFLGGNVSGKGYRAIIKGQDEMMASEATAAFFQGLMKSGGDTPRGVRPHLDDYVRASLRFASSLRAPTESVVAPIDDDGTVTGMQHPTSKDQPKLMGGASGHAFADRNRAHQQNLTFSSAIRDPDAPPNAILEATGLTAAITTASTMSAPSGAENLPDFNTGRIEQHWEDRETIKTQGNLIAKHLGQTTDDTEQSFSSKWASHEAPMSPRRKSKTASQTFSDPSSPEPIAAVKEYAIDIFHTARLLLQAIPGLQDDGHDEGRLLFVTYMHHVSEAMTRIDLTDPQNEQILAAVAAELHRVFAEFRNLLVRSRNVFSGGDAHEPGGQRLRALPQFFAECGQMATHNALVMAGFPDLAHPQADATLFSDTLAAAHGGFENNVDEDQISEMLAAAGGQYIPVLGHLDSVRGVLDLMRNNDAEGLEQHQIGERTQYHAALIHHFITGHSNGLVMVVNTTGHEDGPGDHWIAIRVTRTENGALGITYLDSLNAPTDYAEYFAALRQFLSEVPPEPQLALEEPNFIQYGDDDDSSKMKIE